VGQDRRHHAAELRARVDERRPAVGVGLAECGERRACLRHVVPQRHGAAVAVERRHPGLARHEFQAVRVEVQVAGDIRPERTHVVCRRRHAEAGREFTRDGRAAHGIPLFEQRHLPAGAGEQRGADEAVDAAADDQGGAHRFASFRIFSAAFLPGAPMMPPPGCVADPHM
jgi:hypothetical protein